MQTIYHEFEEHGLAVVAGDTLIVEGIPKPNFQAPNYFTDQNFGTTFPELIKSKNIVSLSKHRLIMARMRRAEIHPSTAYENAKINDFINLTETIFGRITNSKFKLSKYGRVVILPVHLYEKIEELVAKHYPEISQNSPDYYRNTSAMLIKKQYVIIRKRKLDASMLVTLLHEIGHMVTPGNGTPQQLEYYAYCMEHLGLQIFNAEYQKAFPTAKAIKSNAIGVKSKIHAAAFKEATEYINSILAKPP